MLRKLFATACAVLVVGGLASAAELTSGPKVGEDVPGPFKPLNINGDGAGKKECLYCAMGDRPVVMIFARDYNSKATKSLITQVEDVLAKNKKDEATDKCLGSFVVFCTDDSKAGPALEKMAEKEKIKLLTLSTDSPTGPAKYKIAKDADVTVVLYTERKVKANYAFKKDEMKDKDIAKIIADIKKIAPEAKLPEVKPATATGTKTEGESK